MNQGQGGAGLEHHHLKEGSQAGNQAGRNRGIPHRNDRRKRERRKQKSSGNTDHSKGNTNRLPSTDARSCSCWVSSSLPLLLAHLLGFLGPRRFGGASLGLDGAGGGGGRWDALRRSGAAGSGGVGAVEAALEGPRVRRGRAHALGPAAVAVAAAGGRGREAPAHGARRRRGARRGGAGAVVVVVRAVEPALLARRVHVVGRHGFSAGPAGPERSSSELAPP